MGSLVLAASTLVGIAVHESYREGAYYATEHERQQGVSTIGFGSTEGVKPGDTITVERALIRLLADADKFSEGVKRCADVPMHQYEFAAYVSLAYNIGLNAFCKSTLVKKLKAGDYASACAEILRWDKQNGVTLRGLTKRRQQEYQQCLGN